MDPTLFLCVVVSVLIQGTSLTRSSFMNKNDKGNDNTKSNSQDLFNRTSMDPSTILKAEMRRHMKECGADISSEENDRNYNNSYDRGGYNQNGGGNRNYGNNYNNRRDYGNNGDDSNSNFHRNYGSYDSGGVYYSSDNDHNNRHHQINSDSNYNWNRNGYGSNYDKNEDFRRNYNPYTTDSSTWNSRGHEGYDQNFDRRYGYTRNRYRQIGNMDSRREYRKRRKRSEDTECISQCIFGTLGLLDNNRSPSESAFIKWIQDNLPNDVKRIKALRETRKCFAKLATTDNEDGCEFAKSLANCLNLNVEN